MGIRPHCIQAAQSVRGVDLAHIEGAQHLDQPLGIGGTARGQRPLGVHPAPVGGAPHRLAVAQHDQRRAGGGGQGFPDQVAVAGIRQHVQRLTDAHPAQFVDLLVGREAWTAIAFPAYPVMNRLGPPVDQILLRTQRNTEHHIRAGLLDRLAAGGLHLRLAGVELSLREGPVILPRTMQHAHLGTFPKQHHPRCPYHRPPRHQVNCAFLWACLIEGHSSTKSLRLNISCSNSNWCNSPRLKPLIPSTSGRCASTFRVFCATHAS